MTIPYGYCQCGCGEKTSLSKRPTTARLAYGEPYPYRPWHAPRRPAVKSETKRCPSCGETKPRSDFCRRTKSKDGLNFWCEPCCQARDVDWKRAHPESQRRTRERYLAADPNRTARMLSSRSKWQREHQEERRAHAAVARAVRTGKLIRPDKCEVCGKAGRIEGHHDDYSKPLEVHWICRACHGAEHRTAIGWRAR